jgi:uncharacterized protein with HEPN domain
LSDSWLLLKDILERIERVERLSSGRGVSDYIDGSDFADLIDRNLEIIGEAARNLPAAIQALSPATPWSDIVGLRNIPAHHYHSIETDTIWDVVMHGLPELKLAVLKLLETT